MTANFKARLAKLEAHIAVKDVGFPPVVLGQYDRTDSETIGVSGGNGQIVARQSTESVEAMIMRAQQQLREKIVFLVYAEGHSGDTCVVFPKDVCSST
jgi:hypothetical protein